MKRLLRAIWAAGSSRALTPVVIGLFFLVYIGIAFFTEETLITLMAFTKRSIFLAGLLALIPLNILLRLLRETGSYLARRRAMSGRTAEVRPELFEEEVELPVPAVVPELESRLAAVGYRTHSSGNGLSAWRGVSIFPARLLFLAGTFCLFTGILISITSRASQRGMVVEGEPLPAPGGGGSMVERIILAPSAGSILSRTLTLEVAPSNPGDGNRRFGLYPPSLYDGSFVYPRYLGTALVMRFSAPDMPSGSENRYILNCYPPGKEDNKPIPGSPYRVVFSIPEPGEGTDRYTSYTTGRVTLQFKLLKGKEVLFAGSAPAGGEFVRDGYRLAFLEARRLVVTDFIRDYGVLLIWLAAMLLSASACVWIPVRVFFPCREMLFRHEQHVVHAFSRAEGRGRRHAGVFHEALDLLETGKSGTRTREG